MKKKTISMMLAVTMVAALLGGCGSAPAQTDVQQEAMPEESAAGTDSETAEAEGAEAETEETQQESTDGKMELTMWVGSDGLNEYEQSYIDAYNETHEEAYIRTITRPDGANGEVMAAMMAGTAPDILILSYGEVENFAYADALLPLDEYFATWDGFSGMNQNMVEQFNIQDGRYGLPCGEYAMSMLYNKVLFEEAGITPPEDWTWEEFMETAKSLTNTETGQYGFALNWNQWGNWWFQMFTWAAGGDLTKAEEDGTLVTTFTDPAVIQAAEFYRQLKREKCIQSDMSLELDGLKQEFAAGKAAIIYNGLDDLQSFVSMGMDPEDIGVLTIPKGPAGTNKTQLGGSAYVMHAKVPEEKRQAVFDYYKTVSSKDYYEGKAEYYKEQGMNLLTGQIRTDMDMDLIMEDVAEDVRTMLEGSSENGQLSFYAAPAVSTFIDEAIQKIMVDDSADIKEVFASYEKEANKQAVPQYNESIQ